MDKQYRMADEFNLPVKAVESETIFGKLTNIDGLLFLPSDRASHVEEAINTHDVMVDRITELEQERDQLKAVLGDIRQHAYRRLDSNDFPQIVHPEALLRWVNKSPVDISTQVVEPVF